MKSVISVLILVVAVGVTRAETKDLTGSVENLVVFQEQGRFAGWPANHGIWSWGDEILVGFEAGFFRQTDRGHAIDYTKPARHVLARSLDGGQTWRIEQPEGLKPPPDIKIAGVPADPGGKPVTDLDHKIDFLHPGFALTARMASFHVGPSRFYYSSDKGRTWKGPYRVPDFGTPGIAARTDYLVEGKHELTMFLTAAKSNEREGRVICIRTRDGGMTWNLVSFLGPEPEGRGYSIMPSSVRLSPTEILTLVRRRGWIESFRSEDNGQNWQNLGKVADTGRGNPPSLVKLRDGRLVLVYGYRESRFGLRAKFSKDKGRSWGEEIILRDDGGNWDLGYPRTVQRPDGKLVAVYYYNLHPDQERFIGATIWDPAQVK